jgi:hypothetical protein
MFAGVFGAFVPQQHQSPSFTSRRTCRRHDEGRGTPLDRMDTAARRTRFWSRLACAQAPPRKGVGRRLTRRLGAGARCDSSSQVFLIDLGRPILKARRSGRRRMTLGEINGRSNNGRPHWGHRASASRCATASVSTSCCHCQPPTTQAGQWGNQPPPHQTDRRRRRRSARRPPRLFSSSSVRGVVFWRKRDKSSSTRTGRAKPW